MLQEAFPDREIISIDAQIVIEQHGSLHCLNDANSTRSRRYSLINNIIKTTIMQNKIKVGFIQQHNTNDINDNMQRLKKGIEQLAKQGAQLIVLQELHNSLYFCQIETVDNFDLAEPIPGPSTAFFSEIAAANNVVIVTSLFEKRAAGLYHNTSVVIEKDGSIAGKYRKMHIPDDPAYYEKFYFTPGDLGFVPIQTSLGKTRNFGVLGSMVP